MANVPFSKLKCKLDINSIPVQIGDQTIAVKQYLPIQEKLELIGKVIMQAHMQDENYSNPVKAGVFMQLEMVKYYTNITFTEKQLEDPAKLYDMLTCSGVLAHIFNAIPPAEQDVITIGVKDSIEAVYKYQNSVLGILDTLKQDYSNIDIELEDAIADLKDPKVLETVKSVLTKLG